MACIDASEVVSLISKQIPQISTDVAYYMYQNSAYANILEGGILENNQGDQIINVVTNRATPGHSLTLPQFTKRGEACGLEPTTSKVGQTVFTSEIETIRGAGPDICVNQAIETVKNSYISAQRALEENVVQLNNADIRGQLGVRSGVKFVASSGYSFESLLSGGLNQVNVNYPGFLPNHPMTVQALEALVRYMKEVLHLSMYNDMPGAAPHYRVITGSSQNNFFRNQLIGAGETLTALVQGSFKDGVKAVMSYAWLNIPYRGFSLGIDDQPLRFNCLDANGNPIFIDPIIDVAGDVGRNGITNPEWLLAKYEVGFIIAPNSFTRMVPKTYTGEGDMKFTPQLNGLKLEWFYSRDCNNMYGDVGKHLWQITRAYRSEQPHGVIPFTYSRCQDQLGFNQPCTAYSNTSECEVL